MDSLGSLPIKSLILALGVLAIWLVFGANVTAVFDRILTVNDATLPLNPLQLDSSEFIIGSRRWLITPGERVALDSHRRVTLASAGHSFTLGPFIGCTTGSAGACFELSADPGDTLSFTKSRSWLAWPTPFNFSIMRVPTASWHRYAYYQLSWKKLSGAVMKIVWRDEQGYFDGSGWVDANLQIAPTVSITPNPYDMDIKRYLQQTKGWAPDAYRLENLGPSSKKNCELVAAIYLKDERGEHPGAGQSVEICVERVSGQVIREVGGQ